MIGEARECEHWLYAGKYDENALVTCHIPSGNQLKTSDDKCIYIGNDGLCGHPMKSCPEDETSSKGHERIEDKINDQPGACWFSHGLIMGVVAGLGVCSNFHFMKSWRYAYVQLVIKIYKMQRVATAGKERQIGSEEHSAEATFEHEKVLFFCVDIPLIIHITGPKEYGHMSIW
ncbi:LRR RECEPTOR-LIKE SERINE/THREONINE-PROTEIN KINASE FLS2-RELATED [Salix purpurea]|uniref:LRR RECEPTOR-LIKE SERINE/THREONINE-PROTEIN KINASE FLS2-RELATED n=1 Tax=Salix purpurea TaxID=77065 RepID=A0A9Q0TWM9_SALPP|nr:LRR RECEPTOR-LIKE SERINE/THREONINE-PROTEIN KINASE FLS2-RELATED [Salix purpurea]